MRAYSLSYYMTAHRATAIYSLTPKQGLERAINEPRRVPLKKVCFNFHFYNFRFFARERETARLAREKS